MSIHKELHILKTDDDCEFALWEVYKKDNPMVKQQAIFLSHGAFSDKTVCMGIADYLARGLYLLYFRMAGAWY